MFPRAALLLACALLPLREDSRFDLGLFVDPAKGETQSKGEFFVYHEGVGKPGKGYFQRHEPGEVAEFHLFVPEAALPPSGKKRGSSRKKKARKKKYWERKYPLLIVYHGGKDGGSGKGLARKMSKLSTKEHPLLVLSPNMYTLDAYNELLAEGKFPIDEDRVFVMGFSSGGMGVLAAFREGVREGSRFRPRVLVSMSTTASMGRARYPKASYVVVAGEREIPEHIKHPLLKTRRSVCRRHAIAMQQVIDDVMYVEVPGVGHSSGSPKHLALLRNLIRSVPVVGIEKKLRSFPADLGRLLDLARAGRWEELAAERRRLATEGTKPMRRRFAFHDRKLTAALKAWFLDEVKRISKGGPKAGRMEIARALAVEELLPGLLALFEGGPEHGVLAKALAKLRALPWFRKELEARKAYREIASARPGPRSRDALQKLPPKYPGTVYGDHRARQILLAYDL